MESHGTKAITAISTASVGHKDWPRSHVRPKMS